MIRRSPTDADTATFPAAPCRCGESQAGQVAAWYLRTIEEAAAYLNIPAATLRDKVTARRVPFTRIGRHVRFSPDHLAGIIAAGETATRASAIGRNRKTVRPVGSPDELSTAHLPRRD